MAKKIFIIIFALLAVIGSTTDNVYVKPEHDWRFVEILLERPDFKDLKTFCFRGILYYEEVALPVFDENENIVRCKDEE